MGKTIAIGCGALLLLSCLCGGGFWGYAWYKGKQLQEQMQRDLQNMNTNTAPTDTASPTEEPAAGGDTAAPSGGACGKAKACCEAYADAMAASPLGASGASQIRSTCGTYDQAAAAGPASEMGCNSAVEGYRRGLSALNIAVPDACK